MDTLAISHAGSMQRLDWQIAPATPSPATGHVHVWRARLDVGTARVQQLAQWLPDEERLRAERFRLERDRQRYITARGILRDILARYLDVSPRSIEFGYATRGKPFLTGELASASIRFNLAHSQDLALYAITVGREIGIDLEHVQPISDMSAIISRFFSEHEQAAIAALPVSLRRRAFFNCWTRKEAYVKALGSGLYQLLHEFDVSLAPGEPVALLAHQTRLSEDLGWSLRELSPAENCAAAVAVEGPVLGLVCWTYDTKGSLPHD